MRRIFNTDSAPEVSPTQKSNDSIKDLVADPNREKETKVYSWRHKNVASRIKSEIELEEVLPWHFKKGESHHIFTYGNVDTLTYLRVILKQQPLEYLALSCMAIAATDADYLCSWLEKGLIGRLDLYVSRLFFRSRFDIYNRLNEAIKSHNGGGVYAYFTTTPRFSRGLATSSISFSNHRPIRTGTSVANSRHSTSTPTWPTSTREFSMI